MRFVNWFLGLAFLAGMAPSAHAGKTTDTWVQPTLGTLKRIETRGRAPIYVLNGRRISAARFQAEQKVFEGAQTGPWTKKLLMGSSGLRSTTSYTNGSFSRTIVPSAHR